MANRPRLARDIIDGILAEIAPSRLELLRAIVDLEDTFSDKGRAWTVKNVTAEIERFAKSEVSVDP